MTPIDEVTYKQLLSYRTKVFEFIRQFEGKLKDVTSEPSEFARQFGITENGVSSLTQVKEYADHNKFALAFELLAWLIVENNAYMTLSQYETFRDVSEAIVQESDLPQDFE